MRSETSELDTRACTCTGKTGRRGTPLNSCQLAFDKLLKCTNVRALIDDELARGVTDIMTRKTDCPREHISSFGVGKERVIRGFYVYV